MLIFSWLTGRIVCQRCRLRGGRGTRAPRNLADQLTLFVLGGSRFCPSNYCQPPWIHKAIYTSVCDILNKATLAIGMSCALIKITAIHNIDPIPSLNNRTGKFAYVLYYNTFCSICLYVEVSYWSVLCTSHETCRISTKCDRQRS